MNWYVKDLKNYTCIWWFIVYIQSPVVLFTGEIWLLCVRSVSRIAVGWKRNVREEGRRVSKVVGHHWKLYQVSYTKLDCTFYILSIGIAWEHWPDTREFITQSADLWNRWIRLSYYSNRVYILCHWIHM